MVVMRGLDPRIHQKDGPAGQARGRRGKDGL